jgi:hypothetical protein
MKSINNQPQTQYLFFKKEVDNNLSAHYKKKTNIEKSQACRPALEIYTYGLFFLSSKHVGPRPKPSLCTRPLFIFFLPTTSFNSVFFLKKNLLSYIYVKNKFTK